MRVIVATYEHCHGTDVRVFANEAGAEVWRQALAVEQWESELDDVPMPASPKDAADHYFDCTGNRAFDGEWFHTHEREVEGLPATADSV